MKSGAPLKLHELRQLVEVQVGDVYRFSNYNFEKTQEIRDKYFIVLQIDRDEDSFYGFFTTTVSKYYSHIKEEGCFNTTEFPCYFLKSKQGMFHKDTYVQFNNCPDISLSLLEEKLKTSECKRHFIMPKMHLFHLAKCAFNCKTIERLYKKDLKDLKAKLQAELFRPV
jgi:hypothetical protein